VKYIPEDEDLKEKMLYISIPYGTAVHKCFCGCRRKVVTPLSPKQWQLTFDGMTVSLSPSIGSWQLPCKSHYFITNDEAIWVSGNERKDEPEECINEIEEQEVARWRIREYERERKRKDSSKRGGDYRDGSPRS